MPELAEVEFFRRRWWEAGARQTVRVAHVEPRSRVFRSFAKEFSGGTAALAKALAGAKLMDSATHGKQMWFVWKTAAGGNLWLGIHLGMSGALRAGPPDYRAQKHDAVILRLRRHTLVFNDPRQFGRVRAWMGKGRTPRRGVPTRANGRRESMGLAEQPPWLKNLPAEVLSREFTAEFVRGVLARHGRAPLKAVLLNQKYFPGIGNWMADEILWRAALHPAVLAGRAATSKIAKKLHAMVQQVTRDALCVIAGAGGKLPPDLNVHIPDTWLFNHRWENGGRCPKTRKLLERAEIGGRTTCWSPARQRAIPAREGERK